MSDNAFIFMLALGAAVLIGILTVAHVSAYRLKQRLQLRRHAEALAPNVGPLTEPELDFGAEWLGESNIRGKIITVQVRHAETAR